LEWLSKFEGDTSFRALRNVVLGPFSEPAAELAKKFEQVMVDWMPTSIYNRRE
jgi:hypothetical protein